MEFYKLIRQTKDQIENKVLKAKSCLEILNVHCRENLDILFGLGKKM